MPNMRQTCALLYRFSFFTVVKYATENLTMFESTIHWINWYFHKVEQLSPPSIFRTCSASQIETLDPLTPILTPLGLWWTLLYFPCLRICLFYVGHMSGIIRYLSFRVWLLSFRIMSSRFIHIIACDGISLLFKAEWYFIIYMPWIEIFSCQTLRALPFCYINDVPHKALPYHLY